MPDALQERVIQKTSSHVNDNLRKLAGSSNKSSSLPLAKGLPSQQKIFHSELCMVSFLLGIFSFIKRSGERILNKSIYLGEALLLGSTLLIGELLILSLI